MIISMNMAIIEPIIEPVTIQGIKARLSNLTMRNTLELFNLNVSTCFHPSTSDGKPNLLTRTIIKTITSTSALINNDECTYNNVMFFRKVRQQKREVSFT